MKKIDFKKNKFPFCKMSNERGIALMFSIILSAIFLSMALGFLNITLKELNFSSSATDTDNAFYAADSGIECALYGDKSNNNYFIDPNINVDPSSSSITVQQNNTFSCFGNAVPLYGAYPDFNFTINGLGGKNQSCAIVTVSKSYDTNDPTLLLTKIVSKGYNIGGNNNCDQSNLRSIERVIEVNY